MKAIILAAGMGTRLGTLIPKPLSSLLNEKTILDFQIEKLAKKIGLKNIVLVVGYKKEIIMEKYPEFLYVYNSEFAQTNTAKSLLKSLDKFEEDVIWLNGDVYFDDKVLDLLINSKYSGCLVNNSKCADEEIKYTLNNSGFIQELSKTVKNGLGEAIGINIIKKNDMPLFISELEKVGKKDYFEKALENLALAGKLKLKAINIGDYYCKEIDFEEDLKEVQKYILSKIV